MGSSCCVRNLTLIVTVLVEILINGVYSGSSPVIITDDNWKDMLTGEWMVEFMAPWCPACKSFETTWQSVASWSKDLDMNVGVVDVTENPVLSGRFLVTALPTIYHIKDGEFRQYSGPRDESSLVSYVDDKSWENSETVSWWFNPASIHMGGVGLFFKVSMVVRVFYNVMVQDYGIPEWGCYIIFAIVTIIAGLLLGLLFVCCCDYLFPPRYATIRESDNSADSGQDDESDILDDTKTGDGDVRRRRPPTTDTSE
ncbi:thioredoxin-related transmembrane protein 1-like [Liolophura sinensis]|uniref:thioredoxin-related transmembrane protein 1-like n=1 Tax=Liolophura sinensis TaxID=3198878 RepID=UPI003158D2DC